MTVRDCHERRKLVEHRETKKEEEEFYAGEIEDVTEEKQGK